MVTARARNIFLFLRSNIIDCVQTEHAARRFVRRLRGLTEEERLFLDTALMNKANIKDFYAALKHKKLLVCSA